MSNRSDNIIHIPGCNLEISLENSWKTLPHTTPRFVTRCGVIWQEQNAWKPCVTPLNASPSGVYRAVSSICAVRFKGCFASPGVRFWLWRRNFDRLSCAHSMLTITSDLRRIDQSLILHAEHALQLTTLHLSVGCGVTSEEQSSL